MHDRGFIYLPRGFKSVDEMNKTLISNINSIVTNEDDLYILGDICLGGPEANVFEYVEQLNGKIHIILGNHDTDRRIEQYKQCNNVVEVVEAKRLKYGKYHFFLCHYPTFTGSLEKDSIEKCLINLHGHTHFKDKFYQDIPFLYNVGVDSHNNIPVSIDEILSDIKQKVQECIQEL